MNSFLNKAGAPTCLNRSREPRSGRFDRLSYEAIAWLGAGASLWLLSRPFRFDHNDAWLYALMALARAEPARFADDLFLRYGSQDGFSIFSPIYGWVVSLWGLNAAAKILTCLGATSWLFGSWRLTHSLMDKHRARVAFLLLAGLPLHYAGNSSLFTGEGFATARIFAESCVLLALSCLADRQLLAGGLSLGVAGALHPIMALPGAGACVTLEGARQRWVFVVALIAVVAVVALAALGVPIFGRLFQVMDAEWLSIIRTQNPWLFLSSWSSGDWLLLSCQAGAVLVAALQGPRETRLWFGTVLLITLAGLVVSLVGGDALHVLLILQLQLWRSLWLLAWATVPAIVAISPNDLFNLSAWRGNRGLSALFIAFAILNISTSTAVAAIFLLGGLVFGVGNLRLSKPANQIIFVAMLAIGFSAVAAGVFITFRAFKVTSEFGIDNPANVWRRYAWVLVLPIGLILARSRSTVSLTLVLALVIFGVSSWDQRLPWYRAMLERPSSMSVKGQILWGTRAAEAWFMLRSQSYVSATQAAGLVFSRDTAMEWRRRTQNSAAVIPLKMWKPISGFRKCSSVDPEFTFDQVRSLCQMNSGLEGVVTTYPLPKMRSEAIPVHAEADEYCVGDNKSITVSRAGRFFLARCGAFNASDTAPRH